jgi:hypothetical protein
MIRDVQTKNVSVNSCIVAENKCFAVKKGLRRDKDEACIISLLLIEW